jgi:hypothetical protein
MLKRPSKRVRVSPDINERHTASNGIVHSIINNKHLTARPVHQPKFGYQNIEQYKRMLKTNYERCSLPFREPNVVEARGKETYTVYRVECHVDYLDKVYVKLNILKSGKVRVKVITNFLFFWKTYYSKGKAPPFKVILAACKALGYSETFITKMNENLKIRQKFGIQLEKIITNIFDKTVSRKKVVKKPTPPVEPIEENTDTPDIVGIGDAEDIPDPVDEDGPEEDEAIVEEDGDCEVEDVEEEFVDDE